MAAAAAAASGSVRTSVALLRGVNVGRANRLAMADLRSLFTSLGLRDVATYIQSGNVVFSGADPVTPEELEEAIAGEFGIRCTVVLRRPDELRDVLRGNPFPGADGAHLHVGFLAGGPLAVPVDSLDLDLDRFAPDRAVVRGAHVYLHLPDGMARTKLPGHLDRRLGVPITLRNWKTVSTLCDLSGG